ncbi:hypothetical protein PRIC1_006990 [Phytophthora ramorum]
MVNAVVSGRGVFEGVSQILQFQFAVSAVVLGVVCIGVVTSSSVVLILCVDLFMDVIASLELMTNRKLLVHQPHARSRSLVSLRMVKPTADQMLPQLTMLLLVTLLGDQGLNRFFGPRICER